MKKFATIAISLCLILCLCFALVACNNDNSQDDNTPPELPDGETPPEPPTGETPPMGGFDYPGDMLGGGGNGTRPEEIETLTDDVVTPSDLTELKNNTSQVGVTVQGSAETYTISEAGTYILNGDFEAGIVVSVGNGETTRLILNGANVSNSDGIAISNTNKKSTLILTIADGTSNTVENSGDGVNAIHVKGNLEINGNGVLSVTSHSKNAIKVSKNFVAVDANITLDSQNHGISAKSVEIQDALINIIGAVKDGINAECDDDTTAFPDDYSEGYIILKNVVYSCAVAGDGIQADTLVYIDGGEIDITTNGEFVIYSAANKEAYDLEDDDFRYLLSGVTYYKVASDERIQLSRAYALAQSSKGIKVGEIKYDDETGNEVVVTDGNYLIVLTGNAEININSTDDAIHTNSGGVLVKNGNITINTLDDGITSDVLTQIENGTINIESSYEGIEGGYVKISGGNISIVASDDGINAASDDVSIKEYIVITGGNVTVTADGDGLDSNGSILITGGTIVVHGPTSGGDSALDSETGILVDGGILFATSSLGMVETPSANSAQYILSYAQNSTITAGTNLSISDENGTIYTVEVEKSCQSVIVSLPELQNGKTYTLSDDNGTIATFTVESTITSIGSQSGGMGGMPGMGGMGGGMRPDDNGRR